MLEKERPVSHMVIYRGSDGRTGYHEVDELDAAVLFVERLRNDQGVEHARICRMDEVTFEFRPYYRVEVGSAAMPPVRPRWDTRPIDPADDAGGEHADDAPQPPADHATADDAATADANGEAAPAEAAPAGRPDVDPMWDAVVTDPASPDDARGEGEPVATGTRRGLFGR